MTKKKIVSSRPCPTCGSQMIYRKSWLGWFTNVFRRICTRCGYTDRNRVKLRKGGGYR